jgi:hypothetical protein
MTSLVDVTLLPPEEMETAYMEYRRACYDIVYRSSLERGLMRLFSSPLSFDELVVALPVAANKRRAAQLLLDALVKYGALERLPGAPVKYRAVPELADPQFDEALIRLATNKESVAELRHAENYAGIIDALSLTDNPVSASFDSEHIGVWDEVLQAPFYRYSRAQAVREISKSGPHLLDLACGPGYGLRELAGEVGGQPGATIVGVEISPDFVGNAANRNSDDHRVHVVRGDLEQPLDFLQAGFFDGAMIVGAYHFLADTRALWASVTRLLRPGGVFCVA